MSGPPAPPVPPSGRASQLLALVRRLIDYGKDLADTLRQRGTTALGSSAHRFGTLDVALILARITRGLHLAAALEVRITDSAARLDADPRPRRPPPPRGPRAPRPAAPPPEPPDAAAWLAAMPTPEQIAAQVRRRPIGAVIADICRDLGLVPSHPLWRELQEAITRYSGNYSRLVIDMFNRLLPLPQRDAAPPALAPALAAPVGTGPP